MSSSHLSSAAFPTSRRGWLPIAGLVLLGLALPLAWDPGAIHFSSLKRVLLVTAAWFLWGELWSNRHGLRVDALDWAGMLLVGWLLLSLVWSPAPRRGLVDASLLVGAFAVFAAARSLWSLPGAMVVSVWSLALACLVLALWALGQWMAVGGEPVAGVGNQNFLAGLLAAQLPFALVGLWILHDKGRLGGGFRFMLLEALLVLVVMAAIPEDNNTALSAFSKAAMRDSTACTVGFP